MVLFYVVSSLLFSTTNLNPIQRQPSGHTGSFPEMKGSIPLRCYIPSLLDMLYKIYSEAGHLFSYHQTVFLGDVAVYLSYIPYGSEGMHYYRGCYRSGSTLFGEPNCAICGSRSTPSAFSLFYYSSKLPYLVINHRVVPIYLDIL